METKRLYRSRNPKMIGGVCAGLAKYFNLDVVLVRIIFAVGLFIPVCDTMFFLTYIALWIAAPLEPIEPVINGYQPKDELDKSNPPKEEVI